jgi:hypothetical protein
MCNDTAAIADYLSDSDVLREDKAKPWQDIVEDASVKLPQTIHFKPLGVRDFTAYAIWKACNDDKGILNTVCKEEKELTQDQATAQLTWIDVEFPKRPRSEHWKDVAFCDEYHFRIGP